MVGEILNIMKYSTLKFHPHLHAIVTDGLFRDTGTFYVMRQTDLKPLEDLFRAEVFKFLKKEGKITAELIRELMAWRHSGSSIDNGVRIKRGDTKGREVIAQYIIRNVFNIKKGNCPSPATENGHPGDEKRDL